jgi:hypothetical protein
VKTINDRKYAYHGRTDLLYNGTSFIGVLYGVRFFDLNLFSGVACQNSRHTYGEYLKIQISNRPEIPGGPFLLGLL